MLLAYTAFTAFVLCIWSLDSSAEIVDISEDSAICCTLEPVSPHDVGEIDDLSPHLPSSVAYQPLLPAWSVPVKVTTLNTSRYPLFRPPIG